MRVSVVLPLYNGERFLAPTLAAILAQTAPPADIIVVDDGSTDQGPAIAEGFGDRITLLRPGRNAGVQAARNAGIAATRGDWIAFCDQDDLWAPDWLARAAALAAAEPAVDFVFGNFRMLRDGTPDAATKFDQAPPGWWDAAGRRVTQAGWVFDQPIAGLTFRWHPIFPSATLVARRLVDAIGGFDTAMRGLRPEDGEFTLRCLYRARAAALPDPLVTIRRHDANFSRDQLLCVIDEVAALQFIRTHHAEARPFWPVIDDEIRRRRNIAFEAAFVARNHALARRLLADIPQAARSRRLRAKALCLALPDAVGLPLNRLLQALAGLRRLA